MSSPIVSKELLGKVLWPLQSISYEPAHLQRTLARLGIRAPITAADVPGLGWTGGIIKAVDAVNSAARSLSDGSDPAAAAAAVLQAVTDLEQAIADLTTVRPSGFFDADVLARIAADLPGLLIAEAVAASGPTAAVLRLLDLLDVERITVDQDSPSWLQPARRSRLKLTELPAAALDPAGRLRDRWQWRTGQVRGDLAVADLVDVARLLGLPAHRAEIPDAAGALVPRKQRWTRRAASLPFLSQVVDGDTRLVEAGLVISPAGTGDGKDDGLLVGVLADYAPATAIRLAGGWVLDVGLEAVFGLLVTPDGVSVAGADTGADLTLTLQSPAARQIALPLATLDVPPLIASVTLSAHPAELDLRLASVPGETFTLLIDPTSGSTFLADLVGGPIQVDLDLDAAWSSTGGLRLSGGLGLTVTIPVDRTLGPVHLDSVTLGLGAGDTGARLSAVALASAAVGPLTLSVDGLGVAVDAEPGDGLLPQLSTDVVPPAGIGLGVDAPGIASGTGYLYLSAATGEYDGVLDLDLLGVGIGAVGIIETASPDVDGWSVFLALFLGLPSIPLGFGFSLDGLGGMAGINRTVAPEQLQDAVRTGSLGATLFPQDPVAGAAGVIDSYRSMFPPADGRTVFGPVASIGWGTPALVTADVGVVISIPDPVTVAVLGSVSAVLPQADVDVVVVHLDVSGVVDLSAGTLAIDSSLHDSRILGFTLNGDMALRAAFLGQPSLLLSLGGFHPGFTPPPGFPALRRLSLAIDAGAVLRVTFDCYLALASNTVQFGAGIQLSALVDGFGIEGGTEFDALVDLAPIGFSVSLGCHVTVTAQGLDLAGVWLEGLLSGPNPWLVAGDARFDVLGIETSVHLEQQVGSARTEPPPLPADPLDGLRAALADPTAWSVAADPSDAVVLTAHTPDAGLVVSPDGALQISQRLVPLGVDLDHVGGEPVGPYRRFDLTAGTGLQADGSAVDWFAPAQFFQIDPAQALSAPSFELLDSGLHLGGGDPTAGPGRQVSTQYVEVTLDPALGTRDQGTFRPGGDKRPAIGTPISRAPAGRFTVDSATAAPALVTAATDVVDAISGAVLRTRPSWSAAHQSAASTAGAILCPSWEVTA